MLDIKTLLPELKKLVTDLSEDLLARSMAKNDPYSAKVDTGLREAYAQIEKGGRTADAFEVWREDYLDQVAVAWVLGCVFVRFMEDNHLIDECWLAGEGERRKLAEDTHELYFREHPHDSDREYFEHVFHEVGKIPACRDLFAEGKTPLWAVGPSGDMAMKLLAFWREVVPETGELQRSFEVEDGDTRFLGDLYQDLSERARKKYALLQTPVFVEEFILDRTLNPAIDEFGLDEVRMIDPTCGSGHFLLGSFARLFDLWIKREDNEVVAAQKALDGVWGCDINPFAVAIARFRLIVAALRACGIKRLKDAPAWNIHLATGDSLLFGSRWDREGKKKSEQQFLGTPEESWAPEIYACEDKEAISEVLGQQYHAVVGNPPYITVKDRVLNGAYRDRFSTCSGKYSLSAPFAERFFDLALNTTSQQTGYVGTITSNSFMKREFGKKLIEDFFPTVDLTHVIDTAGAFIPGHGTPTVVLFGRHRPPQDNNVRAALGIQGEPCTPDDPSQGEVWQSILRQIDSSSSEDAFLSVSDMPRSIFSQHPWSMGGGGASELKEQIDSASSLRLEALADSVGFASFPGLDDAFILDRDGLARKGIGAELVRPFVYGETIRDWEVDCDLAALVPYDEANAPLPLEPLSHWAKHLWSLRTSLENVVSFGGKTRKQSGDVWWEWYRWVASKYSTPLSLTFAEVASHNHFVLDRGGRVFNQTAPVVKLRSEYGEQDYLALLAYLNSSTCCFYMKQVSHQKQMTGGDGVRIQSRAKVPYQFSGTRVQQLPLPDCFGEHDPKERLSALAAAIERCSVDLGDKSAARAIDEGVNDGADAIIEIFRRFEAESSYVRSQMVFLQEEIDFTVYKMWGLVGDDLLCNEWQDMVATVSAGMRPFEIIQQSNVDGFEVPQIVPEDWPVELRKLWAHRMESVSASKELSIIEDDHYKRRWIGRQGLFNHAARQDQLANECRAWLLRRLESERYWPRGTQSSVSLQSASQIAGIASGDSEFMEVAAVMKGRRDFDVDGLVADLVESSSVPALTCLLYRPSGLRKRMLWEKVWEEQRHSDRDGDEQEIKSPPTYSSADFLKPDYWRLRGKLDVPKERWISFPHCETESDPSLVVGWAGWNHLQQATALIAYYDARKREGWDAKRLTPLLAGLDQLLPWIHQWHPEIDPEFGETAGQSFETMLKADAHELGLTLEDIRAWEPPKKTTPRRKRKTN